MNYSGKIKREAIMNCAKCDTKMFRAKMDGGYLGLPVRLTNIKKGVFDPEKACLVTCSVCPSCGYIELYDNDPQSVWTP